MNFPYRLIFNPPYKVNRKYGGCCISLGSSENPKHVFTYAFSLSLSVFILACAKGTYGVQCNSLCVCKNGGRCDPVTGKCLCPPGVQGLHCENGTTHKLYVLSSISMINFNIYKNIFLHM